MKFRQELRNRLSASGPSMTLAEGVGEERAGPHDLPLYRELELGEHVALYSAVLFLDIRGFTRLSMALPVEETARILNAVLSTAADQLIEYGAHINDFPGDGIMAVFTVQDHVGVEEVHARALFGASHLMELLSATLRDELLRVGVDDPVRVAIGLYSGDVRWQRIGSPQRNRLMAVGEVAPLAAKFATSEHTKAWETVIGGQIADDVPDELKQRREDFTRVYAGKEERRAQWLLDTAGMHRLTTRLEEARELTAAAARARRRPPTPRASSLLGTLEPSIRRRGTGHRHDRGVG